MRLYYTDLLAYDLLYELIAVVNFILNRVMVVTKANKPLV